MSKMDKIKDISLVITTINKPNDVIKRYLTLCKNSKINYIIIGDKKNSFLFKKIPFN